MGKEFVPRSINSGAGVFTILGEGGHLVDVEIIPDSSVRVRRRLTKEHGLVFVGRLHLLTLQAQVVDHMDKGDVHALPGKWRKEAAFLDQKG